MGMRGGWRDVGSQEGSRGECIFFPFAYIQVGFPSSLKLLWKHPHRHTQRCVSWVISTPVKLTRKTITDANHQEFVLCPVLDGWEAGHHSWALNTWQGETGLCPSAKGFPHCDCILLRNSNYLPDPLSLPLLGSVFWAFPHLCWAEGTVLRSLASQSDSSVFDFSPALYCVMEARRSLYL